MERFYKSMVLAVVFSLVLTLGLAAPPQAQAGKQKIVFAMAAPMNPEYGEVLGLNMYLDALTGLVANHPDLKGKFQFRINHSGTIYPNQDECLEAVSSGAIQMSYSGPHYLEALDKAWKLGETPGVISDWSHFLRTMNTPVWQELHHKTAKKNNVTIIKWLFNVGDWVVFTGKAPGKTMADFKGQKIRYPGGEGFARAFNGLGINGVAMPYTEVVSALQTNMIDGVMTDMLSWPYFQMDRYCPIVNKIPVSIMPICWIVNTQWWESLDPKARAALASPFERMDLSTFYTGLQERNTQEWRDNPKLTVVEFDPAEAARWNKAMRQAAEATISGIDPKYMAAVEATKQP